MKVFVVLSILIILFFSSCNSQVYYTKAVLAKNIIESLQNDDFKLFKESSPSFELIKQVMEGVEYAEYDDLITEMFVDSQNAFSKKGYLISDFEIAVVNEPFKAYEYEGYEYIRFYVLLKNKQNIYLKVEFSDCLKTKFGYKLGESLTIE